MPIFEKACAHCGQHFSRYASKTEAEPRYCSRDCFFAAYNGSEAQRRAGRIGGSRSGQLKKIISDNPCNYPKQHGRRIHRIVVEGKIGRSLLPSEIVHHKNEKKGDLDPDNLIIMSQSEHARLHWQSLNEEQRAHAMRGLQLGHLPDAKARAANATRRWWREATDQQKAKRLAGLRPKGKL